MVSQVINNRDNREDKFKLYRSRRRMCNEFLVVKENFVLIVHCKINVIDVK